MATKPTLTPPPGEKPSKYGSDPAQFDTAMQATLDWLHDHWYDDQQAATDFADDAVTAVAGATASAQTASTKATEAATSATSAASSATTAGAKATEASNSAASAASSAQTASTKATEASNSAASAAGSATTATTKATAAASSATTASTKATEAATSATAAASSATTASTKAADAANSATAAAGSATTASTKATEAASSASAAANSATTATTKASEASTSATTAAGSATTASTKATEAATSATSAASSASAAAGSATTASTKATEASSSATAAATSATAAAGSATTASNKATEAAASAASAINAPGTSATSTTSLVIGTGAKTLTIQTGKAFAVGQFVVIASTATPANYMSGQITAHNSGTGELTVGASAFSGTGTLAAWTIALTAAPVSRVSLDGPLEIFHSEVKTYTITDYSVFSTYAVSATAGTVSIAGNQITYTAPATSGAAMITVTRDGAASLFPLEIQEPPSYIATPAATPANFGDPFEGGFYAGMIWNQLTQSSTSKTLATGTQTFTVPSMTGAPIVYQGQTVEVRSRANPANKFVGTVTKAAGTTLTINVTSIGGSGTFSDWSVMARHRIIVAPKASGENASIALKNANTAFPTACQTLTEGLAATQAMRDADTSTVYPAAHWARGLNIGGKTDWYIPARDELELLWRNLKPVTNGNYITAGRPAANYTNNGSFGDAATTQGTNKNSVPEGAAYTATTPGQTAATAFQSGGTEAFAFGTAYYWSSTEDSASNAWFQYWNSSLPGFQNFNSKTIAYRVRAVRRSVI